MSLQSSQFSRTQLLKPSPLSCHKLSAPYLTPLNTLIHYFSKSHLRPILPLSFFPTLTFIYFFKQDLTQLVILDSWILCLYIQVLTISGVTPRLAPKLFLSTSFSRSDHLSVIIKDVLGELRFRGRHREESYSVGNLFLASLTSLSWPRVWLILQLPPYCSWCAVGPEQSTDVCAVGHVEYPGAESQVSGWS